ncbi:MAG: hypothetical protein IPJ03_16555 [Ignavibacteriales bacterium]|nr:hypothetical protein [Ignavibacteriales bacterium]
MAKWNPKYELDLVEIFDRAYSDEDPELQDKIRPLISNQTIKVTYGQRVVDEIVDRTQSHIDKNGKSLGRYSTSYKNSLIFEIYKGNETQVNLTLTGDMLSSLRSKPKRNPTIIINLEGDDNRSKAQGHITGRYGKRGRTEPRDFLGIPKSLEEKLLKQTIKDYIKDNKLTETEAGFSNG